MEFGPCRKLEKCKSGPAPDKLSMALPQNPNDVDMLFKNNPCTLIKAVQPQLWRITVVSSYILVTWGESGTVVELCSHRNILPSGLVKMRLNKDLAEISLSKKNTTNKSFLSWWLQNTLEDELVGYSSCSELSINSARQPCFFESAHCKVITMCVLSYKFVDKCLVLQAYPSSRMARTTFLP